MSGATAVFSCCGSLAQAAAASASASDNARMGWVFLEIALALAIAVAIVWWTLPRKPKAGDGKDER